MSNDDVYPDNKVTAKDSTIIRNYILGIITSFDGITADEEVPSIPTESEESSEESGSSDISSSGTSTSSGESGGSSSSTSTSSNTTSSSGSSSSASSDDGWIPGWY